MYSYILGQGKWKIMPITLQTKSKKKETQV